MATDVLGKADLKNLVEGISKNLVEGIRRCGVLAPMRVIGVKPCGRHERRGRPDRSLEACSSSRMPSVLYPRGSRRPWRGGSKPLPAWAVALALGVLLVATGPALANDSGQVDNPYAAAGISDPTHVTQFLARLKQALAADDRPAVAAMISYPLHVHAPGRGPTIYRDAAALRAAYARVFTPEVTAAVAAATPDGLFARDQGVMIGDGQVWMNEVHAAVKIITINHTRRAAGTQQMGKSR